MAATDRPDALSQLQTEVNRVLEQTGRVFVAGNATGRGAANAQGMKLRKLLPESNLRFHAALDRLEEELQLAQLVLRRDLAVHRAKSGLPVPAATHEDEATVSVPNGDELPAPVTTELESQHPPQEDTVMEDFQLPHHSTEPADKAEPAEDESNDTAPEAVANNALPSTDPVTREGGYPTPNLAAEPALQIDTQPSFADADQLAAEPTTEEQAPDTGTLTNADDFDSLFGGPISAGVGESSNFPTDVNTTDDFDFDAFGASLVDSNNNNGSDNDNLTALLPGLEDYANNAQGTTDDTDFDALFSTNFATSTDTQQGGDRPPNIPHRDSTFDDLLDLPDFSVSEFTGGDAGENSTGNQDFDFDMG